MLAGMVLLMYAARLHGRAARTSVNSVRKAIQCTLKAFETITLLLWKLRRELVQRGRLFPLLDRLKL
jgi:hypothetical protein